MRSKFHDNLAEQLDSDFAAVEQMSRSVRNISPHPLEVRDIQGTIYYL